MKAICAGQEKVMILMGRRYKLVFYFNNHLPYNLHVKCSGATVQLINYTHATVRV